MPHAINASSIDAYEFRRAYAALSGWSCALAAAQFLAIAFSLTPLGVNRAVAWLIGAAAIAVGMFVFGSLKPPSPKTADSVSLVAPLVAPSIAPRFRAFRLLAWLGLLVYAGQWFVVALMEDWSTDGNAYHIPAIHLWTVAGRICWIPENFNFYSYAHMNGLPKGIETLGYLLVTAAHSNRWIDSSNLFFLPLGVLGVRAIALGLGAAPRAAAGAGWLFVLIPLTVCQTPTAYVDASFAACVCGLSGAFFTTQRMLLIGRFTWKLLPALSATMALTIAGKSNGIVLAGGVALGLLVSLAIGAATHKSRRANLLRRASVGIYFTIGAVFLVGGYWMARAYKVAGNPMFPFEVAFAGRVLFEGETASHLLNAAANTDPLFVGRSPAYRVAFGWLQGGALWPSSMVGYDTQRGGWGFILLLGCVPATLAAIAMACRPLDWRRLAFLLPMAALIAAACAQNPLYWHVRYSLTVFAIGLPCFAWAATAVYASQRKRLRRAGKAWLWTCLSVAAVEASIAFAWMGSYAYPGGWRVLQANPSGIFSADNWRRHVSGAFPEAEGTLLQKAMESAEGAALGPSGQRVSTTPRMGKMLGQLCGRYGRVLVPAPPVVGAMELEAWRSQGVRFVLWDEDFPIPGVLLTGSSGGDRVAGYYVFELREDQGS